MSGRSTSVAWFLGSGVFFGASHAFDHNLRCCASCVLRDFSSTRHFLAFVDAALSRAFFLLLLKLLNTFGTPSYTGSSSRCSRSTFQW